MMSKHAVVYTVPTCPRCVHTKNILEALGYAVEERDGEALSEGKIRDTEAMAYLMVNETYPVVVVGGQAVREGHDLWGLIMEEPVEW